MNDNGNESNIQPLSEFEKGLLKKAMDGRDYICISRGREGRVFCNLSPWMSADKSQAAQILRRAADLLDGKAPERMRAVAPILPRDDEPA